MKLHEALKKVFWQFGIAVLQEKRLIFILADFKAFDEYPAMRKVMEAVVSDGHGKRLYSKSLKPDSDDVLTCAESVLKSLTLERKFGAGYASYAVDSILYALGRKSDVAEPSSHGFDPFEKTGSQESGDAAQEGSPGPESPGTNGGAEPAGDSGDAGTDAGTGSDEKKHGGPDAQDLYMLGEMYYFGIGARPDFATAVKWYREAAAKGHQGAEDRLKERTLRLFCKASEQCDAKSQLALGWMYSHGKDVRQDYGEALKWYSMAAEQGNAVAEYNLGYMYQNGNGIPQDIAKAAKWYEAAAEQGKPEAQFSIGSMYEAGYGVGRDVEKAVRWYRAAAAKGQKDAEDRLQDPVLQLFCRATEQGDAVAQVSLGDMYSSGQGVGQDYNEALRWYRMAAEQGNTAAQLSITMLYGEGHLGPADSDEAVKWCRKAAEQGNASAQLRLGMMYQEGKSLPQDYREAVNWYRKAALQGDTAACFSLGRMCEEGHGTKQDYEEAVRWYKKASGHGHAAAKERLDGLTGFKGWKRRGLRAFFP